MDWLCGNQVVWSNHAARARTGGMNARGIHRIAEGPHAIPADRRRDHRPVRLEPSSRSVCALSDSSGGGIGMRGRAAAPRKRRKRKHAARTLNDATPSRSTPGIVPTNLLGSTNGHTLRRFNRG
jgi:hypothetical protein